MLEVLSHSWLAGHCKVIDGVSHGIAMPDAQDNGRFSPGAGWPAGNTASPELPAAARKTTPNREHWRHDQVR